MKNVIIASISVVSVAMAVFIATQIDYAAIAPLLAYAQSFGKKMGFVDGPPPPSFKIDLVCDASEGSTCSKESLIETFEHVLSLIAEIPDSHLNLYVLGSDFASTIRVAQVDVEGVPANEAALQAYRNRFVSQHKDFMLKAIEPYLSTPHKGGSPLAEGLSKIALMEDKSDTGEWWLIFLTDAREVSQLADFECGRLPKTDDFIQSLHTNQLLTPETLTGAVVVFSYVSHAAVVGRQSCPPVSAARAIAVQNLWEAALQTAGALEIFFRSDSIDRNLLTINRKGDIREKNE